MLQYVQRQLLHCHPVFQKAVIGQAGIVHLIINNDLPLILLHGGGNALKDKILIQIISSCLRVAHHPVQGIVLLGGRGRL